MNEDEDKKPLDPISKAFGIDPMDGKLLTNGHIIINDPTDDYNHSRQNIIDLIDQGNQYLQQFGQVAMSAQEPRYIEVLTNLLNSLILANEKLLDLKIKDNAIKEKSGDNSADIINNNLFVGTTEELQTMLENISKNDK